MAGIQIPRVERFQQQDTTPASPKLNIDAPNLGKGGSQQLEAVGNIVQDQADYFAKQEKAAIDTASKAAANEYNIYLNAELNKAKLQQGDPTQTYAQFNENMNLKFDEILNKNPNLSEAGRSAVKSHLADVFTNYSMKANTAYSGQYYDYDKQVTDDAVKLTSQDFMTAASYIDPKDEKSFQGIDALITRIGNLYKTHGEKFGAVTRDENGNQVATDGINLQIGKATSEGLISAINNLNNSNPPRPDLAEALYSKYYKYIDIHKQDDVTKRINDKKEKIDIFNAVDKTTTMSPDQIDSFLNKTFKDNPEAKSQAYEAINSRSRQRQQLRDRSADQNFKIVSNIVYEKMNHPYKAYKSVWEMENDPDIAPYYDNLTAKQKSYLKNMIEKPKDSNREVLLKFYDALINDELKGMSPDKFFQLTSGLNKRDAAIAEAQYRKYNSPQTTEQGSRMMRSAMTDLKNELSKTTVGYITVDKFGKVPNEEDRTKLTNAYQALLVESEKWPANMSESEKNKKVQEFVADRVKSEVFKPKDSGGLSSWFKPSGATLGNVQTIADRKKSKVSYIKMYLDEKKKSGIKDPPSPTPKELDDYIKSKGQ